MSKILEKSLKDARKEDKLTMGSKQVLNSIKNSKLIVLSQSVKKEMIEQIESDAKNLEFRQFHLHPSTMLASNQL
jgi:large subunit ribosomal protein L30e